MADTAKTLELLKALMSVQQTERKEAEKLYQQAKASEPSSLIVGLLSVLGCADASDSIRRQAAVLLRQLVTKAKDFAFGKLQPQHQQEVAGELLRCFESEKDGKLQKKVGDIISQLACYLCTPGGSAQAQWPALLPLVFRMSNASLNASPSSCEAALRLLKELVPAVRSEIVGAKQELGVVLQHALTHADLKVRLAALLLVCGMVCAFEKADWTPLLGTVNVMQQVLEQLLQAKMKDEAQEALEAFIEVAQAEADFFKSSLTASLQPATFLASLAGDAGSDSGLRSLAMEWLTTFSEKRPKWLAKQTPGFATVFIEACMRMMLEVEDSECALQTWAQRMDDEEGDEDEDELYHAGEESIDRFVSAVGMEHVAQVLFGVIGRFAMQADWKATHAALAAVKQTVEYVENSEHINEMMKLLLQHVKHAHPRVRYITMHALGQLANDQSPHVQEAWHKTVMPVLLTQMDDPVDKVAAMAMSAFTAFGEELDNTLMTTYAHEFMVKLVGKLQTTSHRLVREESITCIAVIAAVIEKDFSKYYDDIMPIIKGFVMNATGEKERTIRGKSFECMSLLGIAVGKEKFLPDAQQAIAEMMKTELEDDDPQREYINEASERICQCLKKDFAPFLQALLPGILKSVKIEEGADDGPQRGADDEDDYITVSTGAGTVMKVRTAKFHEIQGSVQLLMRFCEHMEGAYFDFVPPTAEALLPLLSTTDEMSMLCDEARSASFQTWALLIKAARLGAEERGLQPQLASDLLKTFLQAALTTMDRAEGDAEALGDAASGITECLRNVGTGVLAGNEVLGLTEKVFAFMEQSFARSQGEAPKAEDDEEEDDVNDEAICRRHYAAVLGGVMKAAPAEFLPCLPECGRRIAAWVQVDAHRSLGLHFACELVEHLKEKSEPVWPTFMPVVFQALAGADPDLRTAASYAVNHAAPLPSFAEAAPEAFRKLAQVLQAPAPKKRDAKAKLALDNAVGALVCLARAQAPQCPPEVPAWQLVVDRLPLREDEDEAKKVHAAVADLVLEQHAGVLGPERANLGKVLSVLAEVYRTEPICTTETDEKIVKIFRLLPRDALVAVAGNLTEKQQKKIEKILSA